MALEPAWLQLVASSVLALSSFIVAVLTYRMSRRNNFGWEPLLLITSYDLRDGYDSTGTPMLKLTYEVWNRRTYPVSVRKVTIRPGSFKFDIVNVANMYPPEDGIVDGYRAVVHTILNSPIEPKAIKIRDIDLPLTFSMKSVFKGSIRVTALVFDPTRNRTYRLTTDFKISGRLTFIDWLKDYRARRRTHDSNDVYDAI